VVNDWFYHLVYNKQLKHTRNNSIPRAPTPQKNMSIEKHRCFENRILSRDPGSKAELLCCAGASAIFRGSLSCASAATPGFAADSSTGGCGDGGDGTGGDGTVSTSGISNVEESPWEAKRRPNQHTIKPAAET
jgi:hypothetical protein